MPRSPLKRLAEHTDGIERLHQLSAQIEAGIERDVRRLLAIARAARRRMKALKERRRAIADLLRPWVDKGMPDDPDMIREAKRYLRIVQDIHDCRIAEAICLRAIRDHMDVARDVLVGR